MPRFCCNDGAELQAAARSADAGRAAEVPAARLQARRAEDRTTEDAEAVSAIANRCFTKSLQERQCRSTHRRDVGQNRDQSPSRGWPCKLTQSRLLFARIRYARACSRQPRSFFNIAARPRPAESTRLSTSTVQNRVAISRPAIVARSFDVPSRSKWFTEVGWAPSLNELRAASRHLAIEHGDWTERTLFTCSLRESARTQINPGRGLILTASDIPATSEMKPKSQ